MAALPPSAPDILRGLTVSSISLVTFTIGALLVFMRLYVRIKRRITGWDEYTICVALALSLLGTIAVVYQVANGIGWHINTLTPAQLSGFIKWTFVEGVAFVIATCFVKISVCISILRLVDMTRPNVRYFIFVLMGFLIVSTVSLVIALLAQCRPLKALYDFDVKGQCYSKNVSVSIAYLQGAINVVTDFSCAGLPFFIIRRLQIKKSLKIGLSIIMGLGIVTACFSVLRIAFLYTNSSADVTQASVVNVIFLVLEMNLGIIAATIATLRPLFVNIESMVRVSSDPARGPYASDRPLAWGHAKAAKAGGRLTNILLNPRGITKTTDFEVMRKSQEPSEVQSQSEMV